MWCALHGTAWSGTARRGWRPDHRGRRRRRPAACQSMPSAAAGWVCAPT
jgi:hypothetical protein